MNFEPDRVLRNVIDFYSSSGIIDTETESVTVDGELVPVQSGDRQKYEQINLFIFGHLLPTYAPLKISLQVLPEKHLLRTIFDLPKASNSAYHTLFDDLSLDTRLDKLNQSCNAKIRTSLDPARVLLDFPTEVHSHDQGRAAIDIADLKRRFDSLSIADTLVSGYLNNGRRHISLLERAIEEGDGEEALRNIHALKGGALNICAPGLIDCTKQLETAIKQGQSDTLADLVVAVRQQFSLLDRFYEDNKELFHE